MLGDMPNSRQGYQLPVTSNFVSPSPVRIKANHLKTETAWNPCIPFSYFDPSVKFCLAWVEVRVLFTLRKNENVTLLPSQEVKLTNNPNLLLIYSLMKPKKTPSFATFSLACSWVVSLKYFQREKRFFHLCWKDLEILLFQGWTLYV